MSTVMSRTDLIGGYKVREVRDALRRVRNHKWFEPEDLFVNSYRSFIKVDNNFVKVLESEGFIQPYDGGFVTTDKGTALITVRLIGRITRQKALERLGQFLDRVATVNLDSSLISSVDQVYLFGSLHTHEKPDCADVDLLIRLQRKYPTDEWQELNEQAAMASDGYNNLDIFEELGFTDNRIRAFLKNRDKYLSISDLVHSYPEELNRDLGRYAEFDKRLIVDKGTVLLESIPTE